MPRRCRCRGDGRLRAPRGRAAHRPRAGVPSRSIKTIFGITGIPHLARGARSSASHRGRQCRRSANEGNSAATAICNNAKPGLSAATPDPGGQSPRRRARRGRRPHASPAGRARVRPAGEHLPTPCCHRAPGLHLGPVPAAPARSRRGRPEPPRSPRPTIATTTLHRRRHRCRSRRPPHSDRSARPPAPQFGTASRATASLRLPAIIGARLDPAIHNSEAAVYQT